MVPVPGTNISIPGTNMVPVTGTLGRLVTSIMTILRINKTSCPHV